jgi:hypothetical protein
MDMNMDMMANMLMQAMSSESPAETVRAKAAPEKAMGDDPMGMMMMMMEMMGEMMKSEAPMKGMGSVPPPPSPFPPQAGMMPPPGSPFPPQAVPMQPAVPMFPGVNAPHAGQAMPGMMPQQAIPGMVPGMMPQQAIPGMVPGMMPQQAMPGMMPGMPVDPLAGADRSMQAALTDIGTTGNISNANLMNLSAGIGSLSKAAIPLSNQAAMSQAAKQHTSPQAIMGASQQANAAPAGAATGALGGALPGGSALGGAGGVGGLM